MINDLLLVRRSMKCVLNIFNQIQQGYGSIDEKLPTGSGWQCSAGPTLDQGQAGQPGMGPAAQVPEYEETWWDGNQR